MKINREDYNLGYDKGYNDGCFDVMDKIDKQGEWRARRNPTTGQIYCSVCGSESSHDSYGDCEETDFCPNCGTPMTEKALEILRKRSGVSE